MQHSIEISDRQAKELQRLAVADRRNIGDLVQTAIGDYVARRTRDRSDWIRRFDRVVAQIRAGVPSEMTPAEIEDEITANWKEYCAERGGGSGS